MIDLLWVFILLTGLWYWLDSIRSKEIARQAGFNACQTASVQFLDDTVEHKKIWLRRNTRGNMQICRLYFFEFCSDGADRYQGRIILLGHKVKEINMDAYRIPSENQ